MEMIELDNVLDVGEGFKRGGEASMASRFLTWEIEQNVMPLA